MANDSALKFMAAAIMKLQAQAQAQDMILKALYVDRATQRETFPAEAEDEILAIAESIDHLPRSGYEGEERHLAMQPSRLGEFVTAVRERFEEAARSGEMPVLVTSAGSRPYVRSIIERFRRETPVLSQGEIHTRVRLKTLGSI